MFWNKKSGVVIHAPKHVVVEPIRLTFDLQWVARWEDSRGHSEFAWFKERSKAIEFAHALSSGAPLPKTDDPLRSPKRPEER